jgi:Cdc6-like AAA superfamily ATPase
VFAVHAAGLVVDLVSFLREYAKDVNEAHYNATTLSEKIQEVHAKLQADLNRVRQLQQHGLRSDDLQEQADQLEKMLSAALEKLPPLSVTRAGWLQRLRTGLSIMWRACIGPSHLTRTLAKLQENLEALELPGDNFELCQHHISFMLPNYCVRPKTTADHLHKELAGFAGSNAGQEQQAPAIVQLLGMAGMGKSVLALMVAKELEKKGELNWRHTSRCCQWCHCDRRGVADYIKGCHALL